MKKKIIAILVILAVVILALVGSVIYLRATRKTEVCFYVDQGNGMQEYSKIEIYWNKASSLDYFPKNPARDGLVFEGWYLDNETFTNKVSDTYFKTNAYRPSVALYAKWGCGHSESSYNDVTTASTCVVAGRIDTWCSECNRIVATKTLPTIDHKYVGELTYELVNGNIEFNCTAVCTAGCNDNKEFKKVSTTHTVTTKATCVAEGEMLYTYTNKPYGFKATCTEVIPKTSHKLGAKYQDEIVSAYGYIPYNLDGVIIAAADTLECGANCDAYYKCSYCNELIQIEAHRPHKFNSYELSIVSTVPNKVFKLTASCATTGCDGTFEKIVDNVKDRVITASTCTKAGTVEYSCVYNGFTAKLEGALPLAEHNIGGVKISELADAQGRLPLGINGVKALVVDGQPTPDTATCEQTISGCYECSTCKISYSVDVYKPHKWNDWTVTTQATCTSSGSRYRKCTLCGKRQEEKLDDLGHLLTEYSLVEKGTDAEDMLIFDLRVDCKRCDYYEIPKTDVSAKYQETVKPTCHTAGEGVYTYVDRELPEITCTYKVVVPATNNHTLGKLYINDIFDENGKLDLTADKEYKNLPFVLFEGAKVDTCGQDYKGYYVCAVCDGHFGITVYRSHNWDNGTVTLAPTCTATGTKVYKCQYEGCNGSYEEVLEKLPHNFSYSLPAGIADAEIDAQTLKICGDCADCDTVTYVEGFDSVTISPQCNGVKVYECKKGEEKYYVYVNCPANDDSLHIFIKDYNDIAKYLNKDGTINSNVQGIMIISNSDNGNGTCRGGYICKHCGKFVELVVKIVK